MNIVATLEHQLTVHSLFRLPERQVINAIMPHAQMLERSISLTTKNIDCLMLDNKKSYRANELKTIQIQSCTDHRGKTCLMIPMRMKRTFSPQTVKTQELSENPVHCFSNPETYQVAGEGHELLEECRVEEVLAAADDRVFVLELSHEHLGQSLHQHRERRLCIRVPRPRNVSPYDGTARDTTAVTVRPA